MSHGEIAHDDIIGKRPRDTVDVRKKVYRLNRPSLEDYIVGIRRVVTPIYPQDANVIVSQLDIHVGPPGSDHEPETPLEIFEAGTGHGSLTLFLARAIHAANPAAPSLESEGEGIIGLESDPEAQTSPGPQASPKAPHPGLARFPESWRAQRKAVVHTLDIEPHNSLVARQNVRGFGRGIYAGNVDFYVGKIPEWIEAQQSTRFRQGESDRTFLSHAILDLPACDEYLGTVAEALRVDGKLLVFCPSISQLIACNAAVRKYKLPLMQEKVLELGHGISGGRHWDIRSFKPRAIVKAERVDDGELAADVVENVTSEDLSASSKGASDDAGFEWICRPVAGKRVIGGGFLGMWSKMRRVRDPEL